MLEADLNAEWSRLLIASVCLGIVGCGGSSATAPSSTPQITNMLGGWSGTLGIGVVQVNTGLRTSNTCNQTLIVSSQTGERFSGTFQLTGGTTSTCAQSGEVAGSVSATGAVSGLTFSVSLGNISQCTRVSGDSALSGVVNSSSLTAQSTERIRCVVGGLTTDNDRTLSLLLNKR